MSNVAWIKTVEDNEATGKVQEVYEHVEAVSGSNFNIMRAASLWPELLDLQERQWELFAGEGTELGSDLKDLIAAQVSKLTNCGYCGNWYRDALKLRGWSDEKITHILQDIESDHLDQKSRAVMAFADKITRTPEHMNSLDVEQLRQSGVSDRGVLEAAAMAGYFNYMTRLANALGVLTED